MRAWRAVDPRAARCPRIRRRVRRDRRAASSCAAAGRPARVRAPQEEHSDEGRTAIGLVIAFVGIALGATMEGSNVMAVLNPSAMLDRARRHARRHAWPARSFEAIKNIPKLYKKAFMPDAARPRRARHRARRLRREGAPRRPAGARRAARQRSRTRSPARACSSSSTAPTPTSSPTSSTPRTTPCASATQPAAQPFEKAGGFAPTMGIIGTVFGLVHVLEQPRRARDARPVDLRRVHRHAASASARPTSSSCRSPTGSRSCRPRSCTSAR